MSECIVRMEMPRNCMECQMRGAWAFCPIGKQPVVGYKKQRHEHCPIVAVLPEKHGRLVDADALERNMFAYAAPEMLWDRGDIEHKIGEMPSIVPATKGEFK